MATMCVQRYSPWMGAGAISYEENHESPLTMIRVEAESYCTWGVVRLGIGFQDGTTWEGYTSFSRTGLWT